MHRVARADNGRAGSDLLLNFTPPLLSVLHLGPGSITRPSHSGGVKLPSPLRTAAAHGTAHRAAGLMPTGLDSGEFAARSRLLEPVPLHPGRGRRRIASGPSLATTAMSATARRANDRELTVLAGR